MKLVVSSLLFLVLSSLTLYSSETPHLILYVDVNETIIASDMAGGKSIDNVMNELLAKKYKYCWDTTGRNPISYTEYVKTVLHPGNDLYDNSLRDLRRKRLHSFIEFLATNNHPLYSQVKHDYDKALAVLEKSPSKVFPSFYRLLDELKRQGLSHSVFLRSYGHEVMDLADEIDSYYGPVFELKAQFSGEDLHFANGEKYSGHSEIYTALKKVRFGAIRDDFNYWFAHGISGHYAKPFYIDAADEDILSIFFDDNITKTHDENIVRPIDVSTGDLYPIQDLLHSGQAVRTDTLEAILNENYFIEKVIQALQKQGKLALAR